MCLGQVQQTKMSNQATGVASVFFCVQRGQRLALLLVVKVPLAIRGSAVALRQCGCCGQPVLREAFVRSATVLVAAQNNSGELIHPIGRASGKVTSCSVPGAIGEGHPQEWDVPQCQEDAVETIS